MSSSLCAAVQHERKPMLDKKETALASAASPTAGTSAAGGGGCASSNSTTSVTTPNSAATVAQSGSILYAHQMRNNKPPSFWHDDYSSRPANASAENTNSAVPPSLSMFPVGFNLADLTSSLAQRGSKAFISNACFRSLSLY